MNELLDMVLHAHGGLECWREVQSLDVRISLTGGRYRLKGYPEGVPEALPLSRDVAAQLRFGDNP
jgi:hypothetical protein